MSAAKCSKPGRYVLVPRCVTVYQKRSLAYVLQLRGLHLHVCVAAMPSCLLIGMPQDKSSAARLLVPEVALAMPAVHSLVIYNPPTWVGLPADLAVDQLLELDLQVTNLQPQTAHALENVENACGAPVGTAHSSLQGSSQLDARVLICLLPNPPTSCSSGAAGLRASRHSAGAGGRYAAAAAAHC